MKQKLILYIFSSLFLGLHPSNSFFDNELSRTEKYISFLKYKESQLREKEKGIKTNLMLQFQKNLQNITMGPPRQLGLVRMISLASFLVNYVPATVHLSLTYTDNKTTQKELSTCKNYSDMLKSLNKSFIA